MSRNPFALSVGIGTILASLKLYYEIIDAEVKYAYELKHLITANEYFEIKYNGKTPPFEFKHIKNIYDKSKTFGELHEKLGDFVLTGNMPF